MSRWRTRVTSHIVAVINPQPPEFISFPMPCDACDATVAYPFIASTLKGVANGIRIGLRCRACGAEWSLDVRSESGFFHRIDIDRAKS